MKAHAERLKSSLGAEAQKTIKRASDEALCLSEKNSAGVAQGDVVSHVEDQIDIATRNHSMIGRRPGPSISPDRPVALDEPRQPRVGLDLVVVQTLSLPCSVLSLHPRSSQRVIVV